MISPSDFRPAWWLPNAHLQTLWPTLFRPGLKAALRRERLELPDGDFLDLDWTAGDTGPVVVVLHGLEGSSRSPYAQGMLSALQERGWRAVLMHFRGCSGEPNRLVRWYHSGETSDLAFVIEWLRQREPEAPLAAVGYSLGGNVLLKWLGERGEQAPLAAAVAVSVPFDLKKCAIRLEKSFSCLYQWKLLRSLQRNIRRKFSLLPCPVALADLHRVKTFREFDDLVTAPLHGFASADDYYARSSSRQYLEGIRIPTLILHALDDPFMTPDAVPGSSELSPSVTLELSERGGHVGFVEGNWPWTPNHWLERRIPRYLSAYLP
jgi:hypothetical protein